MIVRAGERMEILHEGSRPGHVYEDLGSLRGKDQDHRADDGHPGVQADDVFPLFQHEGVEFLHILEGSMEYGYGPRTSTCSSRATRSRYTVRWPTAPSELVDLPVRFMSVKVFPAAGVG